MTVHALVWTHKMKKGVLSCQCSVSRIAMVKHPHGNSTKNAQASGRDRCLGHRALSVTYLHMLVGLAHSIPDIGAYVWWRSAIWEQGTSAVIACVVAGRFTQALHFPLILLWLSTANDQQMDVTEWGWYTQRVKTEGSVKGKQPD